MFELTMITDSWEKLEEFIKECERNYGRRPKTFGRIFNGKLELESVIEVEDL